MYFKLKKEKPKRSELHLLKVYDKNNKCSSD